MKERGEIWEVSPYYLLKYGKCPLVIYYLLNLPKFILIKSIEFEVNIIEDCRICYSFGFKWTA